MVELLYQNLGSAAPFPSSTYPVPSSTFRLASLSVSVAQFCLLATMMIAPCLHSFFLSDGDWLP